MEVAVVNGLGEMLGVGDPAAAEIF